MKQQADSHLNQPQNDLDHICWKVVQSRNPTKKPKSFSSIYAPLSTTCLYTVGRVTTYISGTPGLFAFSDLETAISFFREARFSIGALPFRIYDQDHWNDSWVALLECEYYGDTYPLDSFLAGKNELRDLRLRSFSRKQAIQHCRSLLSATGENRHAFYTPNGTISVESLKPLRIVLKHLVRYTHRVAISN